MGIYQEMALFSLLVGAAAGIITVPVVYLIKSRRRHGKKRGFKGKNVTHLEADSSFLDVRREEHSAKDY